ncbi:hypothetical protein BJY04DRAFT_182458 [Aspergillus karnatakaensis]|uniref:uncharacterized protein n=1 Tax=Aspergillus karnatakaensis TaxID=1810916 RepID=UPI003CCCF118
MPSRRKMPSIRSEGARKVILSDYIDKLCSLLEDSLGERIAVEKRLDPFYSCLLSDPPIYALSTALLGSLIAETSRPQNLPDQLLCFIIEHGNEIVNALNLVSLQCICIYLLKSSTGDEFALRLYMLLDEKEPVPNPNSAQPQLPDPELANLIPTVRRDLLDRVCTIFTDTAKHARARRMAGKVLAEMVHNSEALCRLIWELDSEDHIRLIIDSLTDSDTVISFFASTVTCALHIAGATDALKRELHRLQLNTSKYVERFGDSIHQFHSWVQLKRHHIPDIQGKMGLNAPHDSSPACYLVEFEGTKAMQEPCLLLFSAGRLDLISCSLNASRESFDYVLIRLSDKTQTRCSFSVCGEGQKSSLSLFIHAEDTVVKNDQEHTLQVLHLLITLGDDMTNIRKALESVGVQCQAQRRSSSRVIELDAADELDASQTSDASSDTTSSTTPNHVGCKAESKDSVPHVSYVSETPPDPESQSSLTELSKTPTPQGTSPADHRNHHCPISPRKPAEDRRKEKEAESMLELPVDAPPQGYSTDSIFKDAQSKNDAAPSDEDHGSQSGPAHNTRSRTFRTERSASASTALRPIPPDTQESLIFPRRRSRIKIYLAPKKTQNNELVDYDEDLRPGDGSVEPTSVSSPLSNDVSSIAFGQSPMMHRKVSAKNKTATKKPVLKARKRPAKEKTTKAKGVINGQAKHASPTRRTGDEKTNIPGDRSLKQKNAEMEVSKQEACIESIERPDSTNACTNYPEGAGADNTGRPRANSYMPRHNRQLTMESGPSDGGNLAEPRQGRGQRVAQKLIAALRGSITPKHLLHGAKEKQPDTISNEAVGVNEPTDPQVKLFSDNPHEDYEMQQCGAQDVLDAWTEGMSQEVTTVDEAYSVIDLEEGQGSLLQHGLPSQDWILDGKEVMFPHGRKERSADAQDMSSPISVSSTESPSTESIFEFFQTYPQNEPKADYHIPPDTSKGGTSLRRNHETGPLPKGLSTDIIIKQDNEVVHLLDDRPKGSHDRGVSDAVNYLDPSSKTIVDQNGSPRLGQLAMQEQVTLKRQAASAIERQGQRKRSKAPTQGSDHPKDLHPSYEVRKRDDDNQESHVGTMKNQMTIEAIIAPFDGWSKRNHPEVRENAAQKPSGASIEDILERKRQLSFLDRLRANDVKQCPSETVSAEQSTAEQEQRRLAESKERGFIFQGSPASKLPTDVAGAARETVSKLANRATSQPDWQTSLHELHADMRRALLDNNRHLSHQIKNERATVRKVLDGYREQCHTILEELYQAQVQRIRLCKLQMESVKQQHAEVCQELISRLEEDEERLGAAYGSQ